MGKTKTVCRVEICFYKPMGYACTYYVMTDNRGLATNMVIKKHENEPGFECLNYIATNHTSKDLIPSDAVVLTPEGQ